MTKPETIYIELNANAVAEPAQRTVAVASQVVSITLRALANDGPDTDQLQSDVMGYQFNAEGWTKDERHAAFRNWILSKGFQDLARGVRESLEAAFLYINIIKLKPGKTTRIKLERGVASIRAQAGKLQFPQLLAAVNAGLTEPMTFAAEFLSLQNVRNCLEHRNGVVDERDVDAATGTMILIFPRLRMFYVRHGEKIELVPGEVIDTDASESALGQGQEVAISVDRVARTIEYRLGEIIAISSSQFAEVAMACHMFVGDLTSKLPQPPTI